MHRGYVKLWRKSIDSRVWQSTPLWKVWCWCLMKANYRDKWVSVTTGKGTTQVKVAAGQFLFGRKSASHELKMKPSTVYDRMKKLEKAENLVMQAGTHYTLVTICNWPLYASTESASQQATRQPIGNQPAGNRQATGTTKKGGRKEEEGKKKCALRPDQREDINLSGLDALVDAWNALPDGIALKVRVPRSSALVNGWRRVQADREARGAFEDIDAVLAAIRDASYLHGQPWFRLSWLFTRGQRDREWRITKLLEGAYKEKDDKHGRTGTRPTGAYDNGSAGPGRDAF